MAKQARHLFAPDRTGIREPNLHVSSSSNESSLSQSPPLDPDTLSPELRNRLSRQSPFQLGESYIRGEWSCEDLSAVLHYVFTTPSMWSWRRSYLVILKHTLSSLFSNPQTGKGIFKVADSHYNLGNDLFKAMLDSEMSYTCAFWNGVDTLDAAQEQKLELICHKLALAPGMRVLDIGCGFGNFAKYAASRFGVEVLGITVSDQQALIARERCANLPVQIELLDYREVPGQFDRVVSIEMIEAVGRKNLSAYFEAAHTALKTGGRFVIQAITGESVSLKSSPGFDEFLLWIIKHIFPNGYLPRTEELISVPDPFFRIDQLAKLTPHYDKTLMAWAANFERNWAQLEDRYDQAFRRRWRYYLLGCAALFRARETDLYQVTYTKK